LLNEMGYGAVIKMPSYHRSYSPSDFPEEVEILTGSEPQSVLFGIIRKRRDYIGRLLTGLEGGADGLCHSMSACTLEIYGRQYVPELKNLAVEITKILDVKVSVKLVAEEPLKESLPFR
ncbi:MAG: hypothetical protein KKB21_02445, partial [Nanoarchaeota archaeon]|nr:hypothetical protein [Nanoarchaeota archaeon]